MLSVVAALSARVSKTTVVCSCSKLARSFGSFAHSGSRVAIWQEETRLCDAADDGHRRLRSR